MSREIFVIICCDCYILQTILLCMGFSVLHPLLVAIAQRNGERSVLVRADIPSTESEQRNLVDSYHRT